MKIDTTGLFAGLLMAVASATVLAADALPPSLEACSALSRDAERLLCYDKAVAYLKAGSVGAPAATAENMFGANDDVLGAPANKTAVKREELKQISGSVTSLHRGDDGMIQIKLDNGQVWRQQDADVRLMVSQGDNVTIVRAAMGTFRLTDKSGRFARFKRVR
jgi:hypothetical protein